MRAWPGDSTAPRACEASCCQPSSGREEGGVRLCYVCLIQVRTDPKELVPDGWRNGCLMSRRGANTNRYITTVVMKSECLSRKVPRTVRRLHAQCQSNHAGLEETARLTSVMASTQTQRRGRVRGSSRPKHPYNDGLLWGHRLMDMKNRHVDSGRWAAILSSCSIVGDPVREE